MLRLRRRAKEENRPISELIRRATGRWLDSLPEQAPTADQEVEELPTFSLGGVRVPLEELREHLYQGVDRLVFDAVLAVTLKAHGVKRFHTCNVKHFEEFGLFEVQSPFK